MVFYQLEYVQYYSSVLFANERLASGNNDFSFIVQPLLSI
jgi:hypothetical protein